MGKKTFMIYLKLLSIISMGKEMIILQFGSYAELTGTHYWNIQDKLLSISEDHRWVGLNSYLDETVNYQLSNTKNDFFFNHPRTIVFNGINCCNNNIINKTDENNKLISNIYERTCLKGKSSHNQETSYQKKIKDTVQKEITTNEISKINSNYAFRYSIEPCDFQTFKLHERSKVQLPCTWKKISDFEKGLETANLSSYKEEAEEKIRYFVEECDSLQGFVLLIDTSSGFSGTSVSIMEHLHDVYLRTPVLSFGLRRPVYDTYLAQKDQNFIINEAFLTAHALQNASLHIPMECKKKSYLNDLIWNPKINYQTSAVIASLLDTLIMPARIFSNHNGNPKIGPAFGCEVDMEVICQLTIGNRLGHVIAALEAPLVSPRSKEENKDGLKFTEVSYA